MESTKDLTFKTADIDKLSEKRHVKKKPFGCRVCTATFADKKNVRRHVKTLHQQELQEIGMFVLLSPTYFWVNLIGTVNDNNLIYLNPTNLSSCRS